MIYADTDFLIAFLKEKDWLKKRALEIYNENKEEIYTSWVALTEILLLSRRLGMDSESVIANVFKLIKTIEADQNVFLHAAHLIKEKNINVFDALHAAMCSDSQIISSDGVFDELGLERIKLNKG